MHHTELHNPICKYGIFDYKCVDNYKLDDTFASLSKVANYPRDNETCWEIKPKDHNYKLDDMLGN